MFTTTQILLVFLEQCHKLCKRRMFIYGIKMLICAHRTHLSACCHAYMTVFVISKRHYRKIRSPQRNNRIPQGRDKSLELSNVTLSGRPGMRGRGVDSPCGNFEPKILSECFNKRPGTSGLFQ